MRRVLIVVVVVFIVMQLVPLDRDNPPAAGPIEAPADVRRVLETSCFDCHSQQDMDDKHREESGYAYDSPTCLSCHPTGRAED